MKFKIITFHRGVNYGAFLQSFSVQCIFNEISNGNCEIYDYQNKKFKIAEQKVFLIPQGGLFQRKILYGNHRRKIIKYFLFRFWQWRYFKLSNNIKDKDIIVFGSDEIWNLNNWIGIVDEKLFGLGFEKKIKLGFAPSFGSTNIDQLLDNRKVMDLLSTFYSIKVRDTNSKNLLSQINVNSDLVLDPTMYINWLELNEVSDYVNKIQKENKKFVIANVSQVKKYEKALQLLKKQLENQGIDFICLTYTNEIEGLKSLSYPNPFKWVAMFYLAEYIVTDTFHGAVFAINAKKPIHLLNPGEKSNKIRGVFEQLKLDYLTTEGEDFNNQEIKLISTKFLNIPLRIDEFNNYKELL